MLRNHSLTVATCFALLSLAASLTFAEDYKLGPDSQRHGWRAAGDGDQAVEWKSQIFEGTIRDYWVYVPKQYDPAKPANVMVFQDGHTYVDVGEKADFRVPIVFDNLISKKQMPVTIGIFINPGHKADKTPEKPWSANNRSFEYDTLSDQYTRFLLEEILPEGSARIISLPTTPRAGPFAGSAPVESAHSQSPGNAPTPSARCSPMWAASRTSAVGTSIRRLIRKTKPAKPIRVFLQDGSANDLDNECGNWPLANQEMRRRPKIRQIRLSLRVRHRRAQRQTRGSDSARLASLAVARRQDTLVWRFLAEQ